MGFQFSNIQSVLLGGIVKTSDLLKRYQITSELCTLHLIINSVGVLELISIRYFPQWLSGNESTCNARDTDVSSILGLGRPSGEGHGNSSILSWRSPWTEEPGGLQSIRSQSWT